MICYNKAEDYHNCSNHLFYHLFHHLFHLLSHQFLEEIEAITSYLVKFEKDSFMESKVHSDNYTFRGSNRYFIIFITYNKSIFNANDGCQQVKQEKNHSILIPKGRCKSIIVSDFLLSWFQLNLLSLSDKDQDDFVSLRVLLEAIEYFKYNKNNDGY